MQSKKYFLLCLLVITIVALFGSSNAEAHFPSGVPVSSQAPLSCKTSAGNWQISAAPDSGGVWPQVVNCLNHTGVCSLYKYTLAALGKFSSPDHIVFAVSADQDVDRAGPTASVTPPGTSGGDSATGFLARAQHEFPIRVNPTPQIPAEISIAGPSSPRISTVLVKKGNDYESCLIAGPGLSGNTNAVIASSTIFTSSANNCVVEIRKNAAGVVTDILLLPPPTSDPACASSPELSITDISVDGQQLHFAGDGVTNGGLTILGSTDLCTTYITSTGKVRKIGTHC